MKNFVPSTTSDKRTESPSLTLSSIRFLNTCCLAKEYNADFGL